MIIVTALLIVPIIIYIYVQQPRFGKIPSGAQAVNIKNSTNYFKGRFNNHNPTPNLVPGVTYYRVFKEFLFQKSKRIKPAQPLPSKKTDLYQSAIKDFMVWMGHSSYFIRADSKTILVDPVFSGSASPIRFTTKSFKGSDVYSVDDLPDIDFLFITHDHWDHLDYQTITRLREKVKKVVTGLGVGAHLLRWGYDQHQIFESDWNAEFTLTKGFNVAILPARHFSGRSFIRDQSLWSSFVLKTPSLTIYLGGDSGYDDHFAKIGNQYGPFDLAILECGQYNPYWKYIHMMPEEVVQASIDLNAKKFMVVHWAKFSLAMHAWDEPINRVMEESLKKNQGLIHPMIGEIVDLHKMTPGTTWWKTID